MRVKRNSLGLALNFISECSFPRILIIDSSYSTNLYSWSWGRAEPPLQKKLLEIIRLELLWKEVVRSRFSSVMGNMKILLTMAIVLGALIILQASSSKEFTLVDTVKSCNCMDYLKWKIWLYTWLSHLSYWPGVPLVEKKLVHHWKDTVGLILKTIEHWNPNQPFWIPS